MPALATEPIRTVADLIQFLQTLPPTAAIAVFGDDEGNTVVYPSRDRVTVDRNLIVLYPQKVEETNF